MKKESKYEHGFTTPEDYFEKFEDRLFEKLSESDIPQTSGFRVPDDYFENFEEGLMQRINHENKPKVISIFSRKSVAIITTIAACIILALILTPFNSTIDATDLEIAEIEAFIENEGMELDTYEIAQLLNEDDLATIASEGEFFSEENLETYLLENIEDTSLLIE